MVSTFHKGRTVGLGIALGIGLLFTQGTGLAFAQTDPVLMELDQALEVRSRGLSSGPTKEEIRAACLRDPLCSSTLIGGGGGVQALGNDGPQPPPEIQWCTRLNGATAWHERLNDRRAFLDLEGGRFHEGRYYLNTNYPKTPGSPTTGPYINLYVKPPSAGVHIIYVVATPGRMKTDGPLKKVDEASTPQTGPIYSDAHYSFSYNFDGVKPAWFKIYFKPTSNQKGCTIVKSLDIHSSGNGCF